MTQSVLLLVTLDAHHLLLKRVKIFYLYKTFNNPVGKERSNFGLQNIAFLIKNYLFSFKLVQNPYITVRRDGSLHIERVRLLDGGEYTCVATNVAGTINKTTTVNVHGKSCTHHNSFQTSFKAGFMCLNQVTLFL